MSAPRCKDCRQVGTTTHPASPGFFCFEVRRNDGVHDATMAALPKRLRERIYRWNEKFDKDVREIGGVTCR